MLNPEVYITKAKNLVIEAFNANYPIDYMGRDANSNDFYVVWFAKTLGNWKALVSTDIISGQYWEVTHNGDKKETYVDHYEKVANDKFTDEDYHMILANA